VVWSIRPRVIKGCASFNRKTNVVIAPLHFGKMGMEFFKEDCRGNWTGRVEQVAWTVQSPNLALQISFVRTLKLRYGSVYNYGNRYMYNCKHICAYMYMVCQSQWPHGLRHELSLLDSTLRSLVQIPLEAWMFVFPVCLYSVSTPCGGG
jgi:hypothetical protein